MSSEISCSRDTGLVSPPSPDPHHPLHGGRSDQAALSQPLTSTFLSPGGPEGLPAASQLAFDVDCCEVGTIKRSPKLTNTMKSPPGLPDSWRPFSMNGHSEVLKVTALPGDNRHGLKTITTPEDCHLMSQKSDKAPTNCLLAVGTDAVFPEPSTLVSDPSITSPYYYYSPDYGPRPLPLPPPWLQSDSVYPALKGPNPSGSESPCPGHTHTGRTPLTLLPPERSSQQAGTEQQMELLRRIPNELASLPLPFFLEQKAPPIPNQTCLPVMPSMKSSLKTGRVGLESGYDSPRRVKKITFDDRVERAADSSPSPPPPPPPSLTLPTAQIGQQLQVNQWTTKPSRGPLLRQESPVARQEFLADLQRVVTSKLAIAEHHPAVQRLPGSAYCEKDVSEWILQSLRHQRHQEQPPPSGWIQSRGSIGQPSATQAGRAPPVLMEHRSHQPLMLSCPLYEVALPPIKPPPTQRRNSAGGITTSFPRYSPSQPAAVGEEEQGEEGWGGGKEWSAGSQYPQQPLQSATLNQQQQPWAQAIFIPNSQVETPSSPLQHSGIRGLEPAGGGGDRRIFAPGLDQQDQVYQSNHFPGIPSSPILNQFAGSPHSTGSSTLPQLERPLFYHHHQPLKQPPARLSAWRCPPELHRHSGQLQRSQSAHSPAAMLESHRYQSMRAAESPPLRRGPPPPPPQRSSTTHLSSQPAIL